MFDLNDPSITVVKPGSPEDRLNTAVSSEPPPQENPLDNSEYSRLHTQLLNYYRMELDRQSVNRFEMAIDEDYYDNIQYTAEEVTELKERGQPATVYNVIQQSINWVIGAEKRGRTDFKILPRKKQDAKPAEGKTKYLKYLSDVNKTQFHRSRAFEDAVKVGLGWIESGVQNEDDGEPIYTRYESWRNMLFDSASTELDGSDMRYQFRSKWVDQDIATALFPDRKELIATAVTDTVFYGSFEIADGDMPMDQAEVELTNNGALGAVVAHSRKRVRLIEAWYRRPEEVTRIKGGIFNGEIHDENDPRHADEINRGLATTVTRVMMRTRVAIMTTKGILWEGPSPYRHNRFKFIPVWGYRRGRDNLPYGMIRGLRDIQNDVNKRMAKALHIISTNKVVMDEGALPDDVSIDEFAAEVARPDAIIVKKPGKMLELNVDRELEPAHLEFATRNIQMIQSTSGVTDELLGRSTNAVSGVAVQKRQEQGSLATAKFFDNLRLAEQMRGELELSLVEQFATEEKQFRITNQRGTPEFITLNDGLPENDITRTKADFVISEAEWRATMRQAAVAELTELITKLPPQVALTILDLLVDEMDIANRDEIVKRIRAVNGQRDPDATEMTPEEQQRMAAAAKAAALQQAIAEAELRGKNADAANKEADAERKKALMIGDKMTAAGIAMEAATAIIHLPTIAAVADNLLADAGWQSFGPVQGLPPVAQQTAPNQPAPPEVSAPQGGAPVDDAQPEGVLPGQMPPEG